MIDTDLEGIQAVNVFTTIHDFVTIFCQHTF